MRTRPHESSPLHWRAHETRRVSPGRRKITPKNGFKIDRGRHRSRVGTCENASTVFGTARDELSSASFRTHCTGDARCSLHRPVAGSSQNLMPRESILTIAKKKFTVVYMVGKEKEQGASVTKSWCCFFLLRAYFDPTTSWLPIVTRFNQKLKKVRKAMNRWRGFR